MFGFEEELKYKIDSLNKRLSKVESTDKRITDGTINFWNLQLQLFELHESILGRMLLNMRVNGMLVESEFSDKVVKIASRSLHQVIDEDERLCLATHLSLQLSGLA